MIKKEIMKKIFFYLPTLLCLPITAMHINDDAVARGVCENSDRLMQTITRKLPKQPWNPHDYSAIIAQCRVLETYVHTLSLTDSYKINMATDSAIQAAISLVGTIHARMTASGDNPYAQIVETIEQNIRAVRFGFSNSLHRKEMRRRVR
jgi:hypothetical protein